MEENIIKNVVFLLWFLQVVVNEKRNVKRLRLKMVGCGWVVRLSGDIAWEDKSNGGRTVIKGAKGAIKKNGHGRSFFTRIANSYFWRGRENGFIKRGGACSFNIMKSIRIGKESIRWLNRGVGENSNKVMIAFNQSQIFGFKNNPKVIPVWKFNNMYIEIKTFDMNTIKINALKTICHFEERW